MPFGASSFWAIAVRARAAVCGARRARAAANGGRGGGERARADRRRSREETLSVIVRSCCVIVTIAFKHELLDHMLR